MDYWQVKERDHMILFALLVVLHVAVSVITVQAYGLSLTTVFGALGIFAFFMAMLTPHAVLAITALVVIYHCLPE